ncbi:MAG: glutamate-1-semialdehyde 2,1-aminomutase, partial [Bdellovibrionales bacterium]|nr:glutamate-1-semialdehyde 2,1-aminomutase [Bdellovibrionales bacterium]
MSVGPLSKELFYASKKLMPGGVSSPVRSFASVGGEPFFVEKAKGPKIYDADGKEYIDYVMSYGPHLLGHAHPEILEKMQKSLSRGTSFGAPTGFELELAKLIVQMVPHLEMLRFVNSGTEATMSAVRLARAATDRNKIIKFDGNYHGHVDCLLVEAGSGVATLGIPGSPGIPQDVTKDTISLPYNHLQSVKDFLAKAPRDVAAIIVEPVAGNMGVVAPKEGFLEGLRELCDQYGALLIFDEVMTGFRVAQGGAQQRYHVRPDITCFGKIIGAGMPVGAYGASEDLMQKMAPVGQVYQAGTLSGNPIAMAAGIKMMKLLKEEGLYQNLELRSQYLADELVKSAEKKGVAITLNRVGCMVTIFFHEGPV